MRAIKDEWWGIVPFLLFSIMLLQACGKGEPIPESTLQKRSSRSGVDHIEILPIDTPYGTVFPIEADDIESDFIFDANQKSIQAHTKIKFTTGPQNYKPLFGFPDTAENITISMDGQVVASAALKSLKLPADGKDTYYILDTLVSSGPHELIFHYRLPNRTELLTSFNDFNGRGLQAYVPCNPLLYDQFSFHGTISVIDASGKDYTLFTNANATQVANNHWTYAYTSPVNALAPYIHVLSKDSIVDTAEKVHPGLIGPVTVTVYSTDPRAPDPSGPADQVLKDLSELERQLGSYAHGNKFTVYLVAGNGGMEYSGATISSFSALSHEVFHSWFATGVFPRYYSDAWLDEALARWFDYKNPVTEIPGSVVPVLLGGYDPFELTYPNASYNYGSQLMAHLAWLAGGKEAFINILAAFYEENKLKTVTTEMFRNFLAAKLGADLNSFFAKYVFNQQ